MFLHSHVVIIFGQQIAEMLQMGKPLRSLELGKTLAIFRTGSLEILVDWLHYSAGHCPAPVAF